jgi:hypothetical protein
MLSVILDGMVFLIKNYGIVLLKGGLSEGRREMINTLPLRPRDGSVRFVDDVFFRPFMVRSVLVFAITWRQRALDKDVVSPCFSLGT